MTVQEAKELLHSIAKMYPTLLGLLTKRVAAECRDGSHKVSVGEIWAKKIAALEDKGYVEDIIDQFASGRRPLPDPADRLIQIIIEEVRERRQRDMAAFHQHVKYCDQKKQQYERNQSTSRVAMKLSECVELGLISKIMNDRMMEELMEYDRGKAPQPEWYESPKAWGERNAQTKNLQSKGQDGARLHSDLGRD